MNILTFTLGVVIGVLFKKVFISLFYLLNEQINEIDKVINNSKSKGGK
jgi:hypothetical protein